jgi:hypothetical protein
VTNPNKFKKGAWISTGGGVPRHFLAPRTSSSGNNPFHTLIHEDQFQRVPKAKLPSSWDIDHSNSVEKETVAMLIFIFKSCFKKVDWCWKREKSFMPIVVQMGACLDCGLDFWMSCLMLF